MGDRFAALVPRFKRFDPGAGRGRLVVRMSAQDPLFIKPEGVRPTVYADRVGEAYASLTPPDYRKRLGLYLTSVTVADFMADLIEGHGKEVRILDSKEVFSFSFFLLSGE